MFKVLQRGIEENLYVIAVNGIHMKIRDNRHLYINRLKKIKERDELAIMNMLHHIL